MSRSEDLKRIKELEERLSVYERSPYKESYMALLTQINDWNEQLTENPINLFADNTSKEFDRAHKYFTEQKPYFEQLEYLRKLMNPDEIKEVDKAMGVAEKLAMNGKK